MAATVINIFTFCLRAWLRIKGVKSDCHWNLEETLHEIAVSIPLFGGREGQSGFLSPAVVGLHLSVQVRVHSAEAEVTKLKEALGCLGAGRLSPVGLALSAASLWDKGAWLSLWEKWIIMDKYMKRLAKVSCLFFLIDGPNCCECAVTACFCCAWRGLFCRVGSTPRLLCLAAISEAGFEVVCSVGMDFECCGDRQV